MKDEWIPKSGVNVVAVDASGAPGAGIVLANAPNWAEALKLRERYEAEGAEIALFTSKPTNPSPAVQAIWDGSKAWLEKNKKAG